MSESRGGPYGRSARELLRHGGPAFPSDTLWGGPRGMTLRDWFAGQALTSLRPWSASGIAQDAYEVADAMLKERER